MILSMEKAGYSKEEIRKVYKEMYYLFDTLTEEEAEERGYKHYYG